jgi:ATP-binding cassette subfamily B protein
MLEFMEIQNILYKGTLPVEKRTDNRYEIEFHNVCFRYPFCEEYALKNVSFKISTKSRVSIVGMNGSGKTTMIKLLCGLYVPESGYITLNGKDISKYDYDAYLNLFAVVFQDFKLLAFPIGQNVATSIDYDDAKVWDSLKLAGISDRINSLPLKLNQTIYRNVKEEGIEISGGEEQKIAIARALYKNAPIYIFDEPTAALDPISEYEIYSKFNEIIGDKAALFVSHRLSSCRFCNTIIVFNNGQIVQMGSHDELLKDIGGIYYELWSAQAQYYQ